MEAIRKRQKEQGFTLIEIIAVLVLLGVLAAVIIPRYNSITDEARRAALQQAIAEGQAQANQAAAKFILENRSLPGAYSDLDASDFSTDVGDYQLTFGAIAGGVAITARNAATTTISTTGSAAFPQ